VLVHFDVDVTDLPAVDVPHPGGLDTTSAFAALRVFGESRHCAAVVVTEFNADRDPDGSHAERIGDGLVEAFGRRGKDRKAASGLHLTEPWSRRGGRRRRTVGLLRRALGGMNLVNVGGHVIPIAAG